ncbi:unnamed protein product, partial [Polarella glacialis]
MAAASGASETLKTVLCSVVCHPALRSALLDPAAPLADLCVRSAELSLRAEGGGGLLGGGDSLTYLGLFSQIVGKTMDQVSSLFYARRRVKRIYQEPHWVLFLDIALILLIRAGAARVAMQAWQKMLAFHRRRQAMRVRKAAQTSVGFAVSLPGEQAGGQELGAGADQNTVTVRGDGDQKVEDDEDEGSVAQNAFAVAAKLISAGEAPVIICCLASCICHVAVAILQLLQGSSHATVMVADTIWHLWVGQILNYTISGCWLLLRLLDVRLELSRSRPSTSGDLSNLVDSAAATSRRFAQEAAFIQLAKTVVWVVTTLLVLQNLGVNISRLLALTSLSGVAFSFLLGDILNNLFGGFVLYVTQPFAQGDWVQSSDGKVDGWIQNLGWYYTTVVRWEKRPHYIPNSMFGFMPIVNGSRMTHRRILIEGPLRMRDLDKVEEILADMRHLIENHNDIDKEMHRLCRLKKVDDYSVIIWISCYTRIINLKPYLSVQESVLLGICAILRKYETNWASSIERFPAGRGDAEAIAEVRRVLSVRSALLRRENDLEDRGQEVQRQEAEIFEMQKSITSDRRDLEPSIVRLRSQK